MGLAYVIQRSGETAKNCAVECKYREEIGYDRTIESSLVKQRLNTNFTNASACINIFIYSLIGKQKNE